MQVATQSYKFVYTNYQGRLTLADCPGFRPASLLVTQRALSISR
jgi:hypothetical protein